jgi:hypothetical protein
MVFYVHTTVGKMKVVAATPAKAREIVKAEYPQAQITKVKLAEGQSKPNKG